ncbi:hypothetical protein D3C72_1589980 [compost metagenome]
MRGPIVEMASFEASTWLYWKSPREYKSSQWRRPASRSTTRGRNTPCWPASANLSATVRGSKWAPKTSLRNIKPAKARSSASKGNPA